MTDRRCYAGRLRNIVISIEVGTTFSGVSYAILKPGLVPQIRAVTGFPGQEDNSGSTKVPTILFYDQEGQVRAAGGQTNDPKVMNQGSENWIKVDWLGLRSRQTEGDRPDPLRQILPPGKDFTAALGDFLGYLKGCAVAYIQRTHADGHMLWAEAQHRVEHILSYPSGANGSMRVQLGVGAIYGGLVPNTKPGRSRLHFVSEGEAMFHWCVASGLANGSVKVGRAIVVVDAGRTTIGVSAFRLLQEAPMKLEETRPTECRLAGSQFVTRAFENHIREHLRGSIYGDNETIDHLVSEFDRKTKRIFRKTSSSITIQFGRPTGAPEPAFGIRGGRLTIPREVGVQLYEPSIAALTEAVKLQIQGNYHTTVFLLGGFANSPYMLAELERRLAGYNISIKRADSHSARAVPDGAVGYFLDHLINGHSVNGPVIEPPSVVTPSRPADKDVAPTIGYTYGVFHNVAYDSVNLEHVGRPSAIYTESITGLKRVAGRFYPLLSKGTSLEEITVQGESFSEAIDEKNGIFYARFVLYCYKGDKEEINWRDEDPYNFRPVCAFSTGLPKSAIKLQAPTRGVAFLQARYSAVVNFGPAGFTCRIEWTDDAGMVQCGRSTVVARCHWRDPHARGGAH